MVIRKLLVFVSLFFIGVTASVQASTTYTITLHYDNTLGEVTGELIREAGEFVVLTLEPDPGNVVHYWYWTTDDFVGPPQPRYEQDEAFFYMPAADVHVYVFFIDVATGYQRYDFTIEAPNLQFGASALFWTSLEPSHLFTYGRLSEAIILVETGVGEDEYEFALWTGVFQAPFTHFMVDPDRDDSWVLSISPPFEGVFMSLFYDDWSSAIYDIEQGDIVMRAGTTPFLVGVNVIIFLPLTSEYELDVFPPATEPTVFAGLQTLLTYFGFWNQTGFLIMFTIVFVLLISFMVALKLPSMAIIVVALSIIATFAFMNLLPFWALLILLMIISIYIFVALRSGKGESYE